MNTESSNQNLKLILTFLIGVVIGVFSIWMWTATQTAFSDKEANKVTEQKEITNETITQGQVATVQDFNETVAQLRNDAIIVRNQPAGSVVIIEKAVFEEDGWIVIHEGTSSHIGNALGAARSDKGEYSGVVELLRTTEVGVIYRAVLYRDNGDKEFSLDNDFPFLQNGNQPVLTTFVVE